MSAARYLRHGKSRAGLLNATALDEDWIAPELSITLALMSRGVAAFPRLIRERIAGLSYRSIRGRPNCGKTLLSANHVMAEIWSPARVSTNSAYARATSVSDTNT
jgi:hypothetical protein